MQKKRVRVYRPQIDTNHFANYMFQVGGPVGMGAMQPMQPMQQNQDISQGIAELLQMYAQAKGMNEQQYQEMYGAVMQMQPAQQQEVISQMQQELASTMAANPMTAKHGGHIKKTKKLLSKKAGGAGMNTTSKNKVEENNQIVKDAIGLKLTQNIIDEETEQQLKLANDMIGQASNNLSPMIPRKDYGGYANAFGNQMMGYRDVTDNPFYNAMVGKRQDMRNDVNTGLTALGNISMRPTGKTKIRKRGDIWDMANQPTDPFVNFSTEDKNEMTSQMFGLKHGGGIPTYQTGATIDIGTGRYDPVTKTITGTDGTTRVVDEDEANWIMSQMTFGSNNSSSSTNTNTGTNTDTTGSGISGWHGGFYWQNGVPVMSYQDMLSEIPQMQGYDNFDWSSTIGKNRYTVPQSLTALLKDPTAFQQFGNALTKFQPEGVYLEKAKARVNPFGAKVVLKWDYDENGRPVQKEVIEGEEEASEIGSPKRSNLMGRIRSKFDVMKYNREQRRTGEDEGSTSTSSSSGARTNYGSYSGKTGQNIMNMMTQGQTGNYMDQMPITSGNEEGIISMPYIPTIPDFAYGGIPKARAGKLVMKESYVPDWGDVGRAMPSAMDAVSSLLEQRDLRGMENRIYTPDAYVGSIPQYNSMAMGTKQVGPNTGAENRLDTTSDIGGVQNYGDIFYQNVPGYELSGQIPYINFQEGGVTDDYMEGEYYEVDDDQLNDIFARGGKVQYY